MSDVLCKGCLLVLAKGIERRSRIVLKYMIDNEKITKASIIKNTKLTTNHADKALLQLKSLLLIKVIDIEGRAKIYGFTENGKKLISLLGGKNNE